jgi:hypothetical protein
MNRPASRRKGIAGGKTPGERDLRRAFHPGRTAVILRRAAELLMSFGWLDVVDLGGISTARAWS